MKYAINKLTMRRNPYMLSKCYWKMYQTRDDELDVKDMRSKISIETLINTLKKAVKVAHNARRGRNSDPILEPHYKIVSILHKLVMRGDLPSSEAATILSEQPFGLAVNPDDHFASFSEPEDWEEYIIRNLSKLKDKDKSNWQHRIIFRHARILFCEDNPTSEASDQLVEAKAAFGILRDSMVTKTMVMNVWKCDAERPGRHHVYTEQYVRFMTKLLVIMADRVNLEQLLRRLRKKGADFYHFTDLWQSCCMSYLKLLREGYHVSPVMDDAFKSLSSEEFEVVGERIATWAASDGADVPLFNCMKDAIELKKLNANLMKVAPIDDLLNDCYSRIYSEIAKTLPGPDPSKVVEERHHAKEVAAQLEAAQAEAKTTLASILNGTNGQESITGTATPMETEKQEVAPRARRAGVRRPDVLRKAEQAVIRAMEAPKSSKSRVGSVSSGKRGSHTPNQPASEAGSDDEGVDAQIRREAGHDGDVDMKDVGDDNEEDHEEEHEEDHEEDHEEEHDEEHGAEEKAESEPGSIHDSADDESDLSDVPEDYDEEVPPGLMFPNLGHHSDESSGEDADSESEGDDEAEESDGAEEAEEEEDETREDGEETLGNEDTELVDGEEEDEADGSERPENWDADDSMRAEAW